MTQWIRYRTDTGRTGFGTLGGDRIDEYEGDLFDGARPTGVTTALSDVMPLAPCTPSKIVALWNNFRALAAKLEKQVPAHPLFLIKPASSLAGPDQRIERPAGYGGRIAFEGELGIVIGKRARNVPPAETPGHIFGYTCVNDVTAVDVMNEDPNFTQWCRAKGHDTFGCLGPAISTDLDWRAARVVTRVDGAERQNYPLSDMVFSPAELVSLVSHDMTLLPGDVIACGTSLGVGSIRDGSTVEISIAGIGSLVNRL